MSKRGQIVGGGLKEIIIREKSGEKLELGELIIVENSKNSDINTQNKTEKDFNILQIKDIEYSSQAPQTTHELLSGMELEGHNPDLGFMEPELANYIMGRAKSLLHVKKEDKNNYKTKSPKLLPNFFNYVRSIQKDDLEFLKPEKIENSIYLGEIRSGSIVLEDVSVYIDAIKSLTHHILIPATTGRGKSNLVKVMLWSILDSKGAGILVLDPHNEYYGDNIKKGLKDHPKTDEKLSYYSPDFVNQKADTLIINIKTILPYHFNGIGGFSSAQSEAMRMFHNRYQNEWIEEIAKGTDKKTLQQLGIDEKTGKVLKRKIETKLGVSSNDGVNCNFRSKLFVGGDSGLTTVPKITESLEKGKIVIIDSSKLSDFEELFVGSIISTNVFNKYKQYNSSELKSKPVISIVIEEAPRVLGKEAFENQGGNNIYSTIAREGRKFKIGLIAITQLSSVIPKAILANMNTKIILGNEMSIERTAIIESASQDLSEDSRIIASLDKGEAIVSSVFTRFAIPIYTPKFEKYIEKFLEKQPKKLVITGKTNIPG